MSTSELEAKASTMGWLPKEKYLEQGRPEKNWVDAETYVERGEQFLPLLQANNRKLIEKVTAVEQQNAVLSTQLREASEAIEALKDLRTTLNIDKVKAQKSEILAGIKQAREDDDVEAEVQLTDKLSEVNLALRESAKPKPPAETPALSTDALDWMSQNPWFGNGAEHDAARTGYAMGLAKAWVASGKKAGTKEFFQHVDQRMSEVFDPNASRRSRGSKVDESTNSDDSATGGSTKRNFADLPPEAKAAFERQAKSLVGPNKVYKTRADLQRVYLEQFDWS